MSGVNREKESNYLLHVLAYNLLSIRSQRNLSQEDLEDLTGVSVNETVKLNGSSPNETGYHWQPWRKGLEIDAKQLLDPHWDTAAASLYPGSDLVEQVRSALTGLPEEEQKYLVRLLVWQAAHYRNYHPENI